MNAGKRTWLRLTAAVIAVTVIAGPAAVAEPQEDLDRLVSDTSRPLDAALSSFEGEDADGPPEPNRTEDPTAPYARIAKAERQALALAEAHPESGPALEPVIEAIEAARTEYGNGETDILRVTARLTEAAEAAQAAAVGRAAAPGLVEIREGIAAAAERILQRWIEIGSRAGLDAATLGAAHGALAAGRDEAAAGDLAGATGQYGKGVGPILGGVKWNSFEFQLRLIERFKKNSVGLQFTIWGPEKLSVSYRSGSSRLKQDELGGALKMNTEMDIAIASVSKIVTTVAILQLLDKKNMKVTDPVKPYLPQHWTYGTDMNELTFEDLLTHRSGLLGKNPSCCPGWSGIRSAADLGRFYVPDPEDPNKTDYVYQNVNFGLLGLVIARLSPDGSETLKLIEYAIESGFMSGKEGQSGDEAYRVTASNAYVSYVNEFVLKAAGIAEGGACSNSDPNRVLYYDMNDLEANGGDISFIGSRCPYGGWHLSTSDLREFMKSLRFGSLLSSKARSAMYSKFLGWAPPDKNAYADGAHGSYHGHGGDLNFMDACILSFPNGVQVALVTNSINGDYRNGDDIVNYQCNGISFDFDNSWVKA